MANILNKIFEKEKIKKGDQSADVEVEKIDQDRETLIEKESSAVDKSGEEQKSLEKSGEALRKAKSISPVAVSSEEERQREIDQILSDGLEDIFMNMNSAEKKKFRDEGEKTVLMISELLKEAKVKVSKIVELIKRWLKIIPGVNRYFLEQEAKIKADKIVKLKK